jgi:hypothetical protein
MISVILEQVFHLATAVVSFPEEAFGQDVVFQVLDDLDRLVREAVELGFREVEPVVMPGKEVVHQDKDGEHQDDDKEKVARIKEGFPADAPLERGEVEGDINDKSHDPQQSGCQGRRFLIRPNSQGHQGGNNKR